MINDDKILVATDAIIDYNEILCRLSLRVAKKLVSDTTITLCLQSSTLMISSHGPDITLLVMATLSILAGFIDCMKSISSSSNSNKFEEGKTALNR